MFHTQIKGSTETTLCNITTYSGTLSQCDWECTRYSLLEVAKVCLWTQSGTILQKTHINTEPTRKRDCCDQNRLWTPPLRGRWKTFGLWAFMRYSFKPLRDTHTSSSALQTKQRDLRRALHRFTIYTACETPHSTQTRRKKRSSEKRDSVWSHYRMCLTPLSIRALARTYAGRGRCPTLIKYVLEAQQESATSKVMLRAWLTYDT